MIALPSRAAGSILLAGLVTLATGGGSAASATCPGAGTSAASAGPSPAWRDAVVYEAFVRSVADDDGDGIGDLRGLLRRLDHLNDGDPATSDDLGVGALWLTPIMPSPSYHGYDVTDLGAVDPRYGTRDDLRALVDAAHARGMRVLLDLVVNHTSAEHPWFRDALAGGPHRSWYIWSETDPGWPPVAGTDPWHPAATGGFYYGAFDPSMPDLDLRNPAVTAALIDIARGWLALGVDGFRIDAAKHLIEDGPAAQTNTPETKAWLAAFRDAIHETDPDALVIGEVWDGRAVSSSYVTDGSLDMAFDFDVRDEIVSAIARGDAATIARMTAELAGHGAGGGAGTFLSNHDLERIASTLGGRVPLLRLAAAVLLTSPGVPFIYYGEEIGLPGTKPDELIRTPMPWDATLPGHGFTTGVPWEPFAPTTDPIDVASQAADPRSLLTTYRELIHLREAHPALGAGGDAQVLATGDKGVVAILRSLGEDRILVLHNLGRKPVSAYALSLDAGATCGDPAPRLLWSSTGEPETIARPAVGPSGAVDGWLPVGELAPWSTLVISLGR